ncbi:MAG: methionyl-tRNA formyltransferase [Firmicutes bacterium]|nr:methionyl-tRNA formyltransferase [Bacillota bacterium]
MKLIFMGSPEFAVPHLEVLLSSPHHVACVFTQPDRPRSRGRRYLPTPVRISAEERQIPVYTPNTLRGQEILGIIEAIRPDVIVVVAYGLLIPKDILGIPPKGCINVHASLLPKYRGAAPVERAIMAGEEVTGVTTMYMAEGWDTGDMILQEKMEIPEDMTCGELSQKLAARGSALLARTLQLIEAGVAPRIPQDESLATYAPKLAHDEFLIDWRKPARVIHNLVRAGNPRPGAFTYLQGKRFKIFAGKVVPDENETLCGTPVLPGKICRSSPQNLIVATGEGFYSIEEVQREGSKRLAIGDYLCGNPVQAGDVLGT